MELNARLESQIRFLVELDKLKSIFRQTVLIDRSRNENTAEHSWQLATAVTVLSEYAASRVDLARALRMALVHDVVEIDAGDTFVYDTAASSTKSERECAAAERIFGILPEEQATEYRALWEEFEAKQSPEARFVNALDRLLPMLQNSYSGGYSWRKHGIRRAQVNERNRAVADESPELWSHAMRLLD